jgi:hypothetical protein
MFPVKSTKTERQFGAAAVAVCISWFNLIWFMRRIPDIGTYILTLQKVFKTLVKVNEVYYCFSGSVSITKDPNGRRPQV